MPWERDTSEGEEVVEFVDGFLAVEGHVEPAEGWDAAF